MNESIVSPAGKAALANGLPESYKSLLVFLALAERIAHELPSGLGITETGEHLKGKIHLVLIHQMKNNQLMTPGCQLLDAVHHARFITVAVRDEHEETAAGEAQGHLL